MPVRVRAVSKDGQHRFSKVACERIRLIEGRGVDGDAHAGVTVQHRSRVARDPGQPNLRQVHLLGTEFFELAATAGYRLSAGDMGENVLIEGLDLLGLPTGTRLRLGQDAVVEVTGLRNPCAQIDRFQPGLLAVAAGRDEAGRIERRAGVMSVVVTGGAAAAGDPVAISLPPEPHLRLEVV